MGWNYNTLTVSCTLCSRPVNGTRNRYDGINEFPAAATHGFYGSNGNWVGMVLLNTSLAGLDITGIHVSMTANAAGSTGNKSVYFYTSNYQTTTASGKGSIYPNSMLGSISGTFRNATTEIDLTGSLLTEMASYLSGGSQMLILYDPNGSTANYCRFTGITLTINYRTYVETQKTVKICHNGQWLECAVAVRQNGRWVEDCEVNIRGNGQWVETSHR